MLCDKPFVEVPSFGELMSLPPHNCAADSRSASHRPGPWAKDFFPLGRGNLNSEGGTQEGKPVKAESPTRSTLWRRPPASGTRMPRGVRLSSPPGQVTPPHPSHTRHLPAAPHWLMSWAQRFPADRSLPGPSFFRSLCPGVFPRTLLPEGKLLRQRVCVYKGSSHMWPSVQKICSGEHKEGTGGERRRCTPWGRTPRVLRSGEKPSLTG